MRMARGAVILAGISLVVSNSWGDRWSSCSAYKWLEEACCGALSLLALERLAARWERCSIFNDTNYAKSLRTYRDERLNEYVREGSLDPARLKEWWASAASALAAGESLNETNKPLAGLLYGWMGERPSLWHDMRALNRWLRPPELTLESHLQNWKECCAQLGTAGELPLLLHRSLFPSAG